MPIRARRRSIYLFTIYGWELAALAHYHQLVEKHLPTLVEMRGSPIANRPAEQVRIDLEQSLIDAMLPNTLRNPILISAWATYESALVDMASYFARRLSLPFALTDPKERVPASIRTKWRGAFLKRAKLYYSELLGINVIPSGQEIRLSNLHLLRNVLAHGGGRQSTSKATDWDRLTAIANRGVGLSLNRGFVDVTAEYVEGRLGDVDTALKHAVEAARGAAEAHGIHA